LSIDKKTEIEAATFRKMVNHFQERPDVQNIDIMDLVGFCRNCLSRWYQESSIDVGEESLAESLMEKMQQKNIGFLAVSLGYFKTLFSLPGNSTSSEISDEEQIEMGLSKGIIRLSVGIDDNIEGTFEKMKNCMNELGILKK